MVAWDKSHEKISRLYSYSLGDFHDFDFCVFSFLVKHHLNKKYQLAVGNVYQAIGTLLDLGIKQYHKAKLYKQPLKNAVPIIASVSMLIREKVSQSGKDSFYSKTVEFLSPQTIQEASRVFENYYHHLDGQIKFAISNKEFWDYILTGGKYKLWGGPDSIEMGEDGIPEVVDYKYFHKENGEDRLDMEKMPKLYLLLVSRDLIKLGYKKARFTIRLWQKPKDNTLSFEFDLANISQLEEYFYQQIEEIVNLKMFSFCTKHFCQVCSSPQRNEWVNDLKILNIHLAEAEPQYHS